MSKIILFAVRSLLLASVLCLATSTSIAQEQPPGMDAVNEAMKKVSEGKLLAAIARLEALPKEENSMAAQVLPTLYSFAGRVTERASAGAAESSAITRVPEDVAVRDALDAIVAAGRDHQLVIINEAHDAPLHRAFILQLAKRLRAEGFEYYAAEGINEDAAELAKRGYASQQTGFYTQEPLFAELLRGVLELGYQPVAYEAVGSRPTGDQRKDIETREKSQAKNLIDRVLAKNPQARMLIHVGYSHARELPQRIGDGEVKWMAAQLKEDTGIDPLTIDQTVDLDPADGDLAMPESAFVLEKPAGGFYVGGRNADAMDMQVFHPPHALKNGRPGWLYDFDGRVPVELPAAITAKEARVLVQAYHADNTGTAIPADRFILEPGKERPPLLLAPGKYTLVTQDTDGNELTREPLDVK